MPRKIGMVCRDAAAVSALTAFAFAQSPGISLTDVTQVVGIDWVQDENNTMMGAGGAFLDFDGDGAEDILLVGGDSVPGLYRNVGGGASFVPVLPSPLTGSFQAESMCVTVADIDNDGDPDVFIGRFGPNQLFRNDGGGAFTEITTPALAGTRYGFTTTAAFGDYDADGNLDLYIGNYVALGSRPPYHTPTPNVLFRGHGDGTFTEILGSVVAGAGTALATAWSDFDGDGDVDILLGNDFGATVEPNRVYRNDGPGAAAWTFAECSAALRADLRIFCMGIAIGDFDRDGDLDDYFTNMGRNVFLRNDGGRFTDITTETGTELALDVDTSPPLLATSWGTGFHDFDNDGWLDLYVSNGHIPADPSMANGEHTRDVVFRHDGPALTYTRAPLQLSDGIGRGVAFGDYDRDGDVDVLQMNVGGRPVLLRNDSPRRGHWFGARLRGRISNRDALGARVDLDVGGFVAVREVRRNDSFESSSSPRLHFGLGQASSVRSAVVRWPSGVEQRVHDLAVDQAIELVEPVVTVGDARVRTFGMFGGRLVLVVGRLQNRTDDDVTAVYAPELRAGDGATLWQGGARAARLPAGRGRPVVWTTFVPRALGDPRRMDLDFVWTVADAGLGRDEAKFAIR